MKLTSFLILIIYQSIMVYCYHLNNHSPSECSVIPAEKEIHYSNILVQDSTKVNGIEQKGPFKMYTHRPGDQDRYNKYKGDPKVEILNKKGVVVKTINIIKTQQLLPKYDSISPHPNSRNMFRIHLTDTQDVYEYVNTDYFGMVKPRPDLMYEIRYEINNEVLWIQNIAYGSDTDVYGGQTEIIGIDSSGKEIARMQLKGWMASMSVTEDNNYLAIKTGGQATERVEYFNPMRYYAIDINNEKIIYQYSSEGDCIFGGTSKDYLYAMLIKNRNCGSNMNGLYKIIILFPEKNFIYILQADKIPKESVPLFREDYLEFHISGRKNIIMSFKEDFESCPIEK